MPADPRPFRCGHVTLAGQPNAGKSTLLNRLIGEKLAIVSPKPQTTRLPLRGIYTGTDFQSIFVDTPGIHKAKSPLNRAMVGFAIEALESVDAVVLVIDATKAAQWVEKLRNPPEPEAGKLDYRIPPGDRRIIQDILRYNRKWLIALNKVDLVRPIRLLPVMQALVTAPDVGAIVPISAQTGDGVAQLLEAIRTYLPEGEAEYGADELTDQSLRFLVAEFVREQVFLQTHEEVPYGVACEVENWQDLADLTHVQVVVHVEKPAQKAILVGKGGQRCKEIGTHARLEMERLLGRKVFLEVHVHVEPDWSTRVEKLKEFGYVL